METTQARFLRQVEEIAGRYGVEVVKDGTASNVFTLRFMPRRRWDPILVMGCTFDNAHSRFRVEGDALDHIGRPSNFVGYRQVDLQAIPLVTDYVDESLHAWHSTLEVEV